MERNAHLRETAARMFVAQPERLAAAWRRERFSDGGRSTVPENLLDGVVEDFIRQIGHALKGAEGHPWSRTRGVLRLSVARGTRGLHDEFGALRRCLLDALGVIGAPRDCYATTARVIEEAADSAVAILRRLGERAAPPPRVPFGGLVVEIVEARPRPRLASAGGGADAVH